MKSSTDCFGGGGMDLAVLAHLRRRTHVLRTEIAAAQNKRTGIDKAIADRSRALDRLEAQLALREAGTAHCADEQ